jgi:hypothetical protein
VGGCLGGGGRAGSPPTPPTAAAAYLAAFAEEIKASGLLGTLIERHGAQGLTIAR